MNRRESGLITFLPRGSPIRQDQEALLGIDCEATGCCVDTVELDADMIEKYVRCQEKKAQQMEQLRLID